jgi:hypothetical protein
MAMVLSVRSYEAAPGRRLVGVFLSLFFMMPSTSAPARLARSRISTAVPYFASSSKLTKMTFLSRNFSWFSSCSGSLALSTGCG